MPKSITVRCFLLFFAVFTVIVKADEGIDFIDCGSYLAIREVSISSCLETPCIFTAGDNFTVNILLTDVNKLDRTELVTEAYLRMFGIKWPLKVTPVNPCDSQWACPILMQNNLTYTADVRMLDDVMRRPAHIQVLLRNAEDDELQALCIEFSAELQ